MPILLGRLTEGMVWMTWRICCPLLPCVEARMEPGERTAGMAEVELRPEGGMDTVVGAGSGGATSMGEDWTEVGGGGGGAEAGATLDLLRERSTGSAWGWLQSLASSSSGGSVLMSASSTGGSRGPSASSADELMAGVAFPWPCKRPAVREEPGKLRHGAGAKRFF